MIGLKRKTTLAAAVMLLSAGTAHAVSTANSGECSMKLASPAFAAAVGLQNNIANGGPGVTPGEDHSLSFFARGYVGTTGNANYAVRYLDASGNIVGSTSVTDFGTKLPPNGDWVQVTNDLSEIDTDASGNVLGVPAGATSVFIEIVQAIGPTSPTTNCGSGTPAGLCFFPGEVFVDDVVIGVTAGPNVLVNGGFETVDSVDNTLAANWQEGNQGYTRDCGDDGVQVPVLPPFFAMLLGGSLLGLGALKFRSKSRS
ncbi:MAG: hypothetical protein WBN40_05145 [Pseudomonadales bacterium]